MVYSITLSRYIRHSDLVMYQSLQILFPYKLLRNINYSSLCCTVLESERPSDSNQMIKKMRKTKKSKIVDAGEGVEIDTNLTHSEGEKEKLLGGHDLDPFVM